MNYRNLDNKEFCEAFERRARKYARINRLFSKGDIIKVKGKVNEFLIKKILGKFPVEIKKSGKVDKIFEERSLDDEACSFLNDWFNGKKTKGFKSYSLLRIFSDKDIERFAKFNGIKFVPAKKDKDILILLNQMRDKYPGSDFTLLGNIDKLNRLTNN